MKIENLKQIDKSFTLVSKNPDDINLIGICHSDEPRPETFCFVKNNKFLKRIGRRIVGDKQFTQTGIILDEKFLASNEGILTELEPRFAWVATVRDISRGMCLFSKPFYDKLYSDLNYNIDGRQLNLCDIHVDAEIAQGVFIGSGCSIGADVRVMPGAVIMPNVTIASGTIIFPNVTVYPYTKIGENCRIHSGTTIGADGFGYNFFDGVHNKIWHLCGVEIGNNVEIGSNACIDSGAFNPTRIGNGSKLDNSVQISHNTIMGEHNILCGKAGMAGSAELGNYCVLGAYAGPAPGAIVGNQVQLGAFGVIGEGTVVEDGAVLAGHPARPLKDWIRGQAKLRQLIKK